MRYCYTDIRQKSNIYFATKFIIYNRPYISEDKDRE